MYEIKTENVYEDFSKDRENFDLSNYSTKSKDHDDSYNLVTGNMKDETGGFPIEEFAGLLPKFYSFSINDNIAHKKAKDVNQNFVEKITHSEYKDVSLNQKCLRHSINIQSKNHRLETYEINKIYLTCFDDKMYILNNRYHGLALDY